MPHGVVRVVGSVITTDRIGLSEVIHGHLGSSLDESLFNLIKSCATIPLDLICVSCPVVGSWSEDPSCIMMSGHSVNLAAMPSGSGSKELLVDSTIR